MGSAAGSQGCTLFAPTRVWHALCHGNESLSGVEGARVSPRSVETIRTGSGCSAFRWNQGGDPVRAGGGQRRSLLWVLTGVAAVRSHLFLV